MGGRMANIREFSSFFVNDRATAEIYPLSLHAALPIFPPGRAGFETSPPPARWGQVQWRPGPGRAVPSTAATPDRYPDRDRKSTRLNSSHANISYAVFCLKKNRRHSHRVSCI